MQPRCWNPVQVVRPTVEYPPGSRAVIVEWLGRHERCRRRHQCRGSFQKGPCRQRTRRGEREIEPSGYFRRVGERVACAYWRGRFLSRSGLCVKVPVVDLGWPNAVCWLTLAKDGVDGLGRLLQRAVQALGQVERTGFASARQRAIWCGSTCPLAAAPGMQFAHQVATEKTAGSGDEDLAHGAALGAACGVNSTDSPRRRSHAPTA